MNSGDYLQVNQANWDARAQVHAEHYGLPALLADPTALSATVRFDLPRLGTLTGLSVVHLQCHLGTDTLSLARLGAESVTGVDLSGKSLEVARELAQAAKTPIDFVQCDVYSAPEVLAREFDVVYTGIGALCWLPSIERWAQTVAALLRPGGRLFIRDGHPMLDTLVPVVLAEDPADRSQQPAISGANQLTAAVELPYFQQEDGLIWTEEFSYAGEEPVAEPSSISWSHGIGEIITALLDAGLTITGFTEHDSAPWEALPGLMVNDPATGEWRLEQRPERLAATFTLTAIRP